MGMGRKVRTKVYSMQHAAPLSTPRIGVHDGEAFLPAVALKLEGQQAYLVVEPTPRIAEHTRLRLDWDDGRVTELAARVRNFDTPSNVTTLDICGVDGDWKPFLEYLALGTA